MPLKEGLLIHIQVVAVYCSLGHPTVIAEYDHPEDELLEGYSGRLSNLMTALSRCA